MLKTVFNNDKMITSSEKIMQDKLQSKQMIPSISLLKIIFISAFLSQLGIKDFKTFKLKLYSYEGCLNIHFSLYHAVGKKKIFVLQHVLNDIEEKSEDGRSRKLLNCSCAVFPGIHQG